MSYKYRVMIAQTQLKGIGLWSPDLCGPLEQPEAKLSVNVNWDAQSNDSDNINGEYAIIRNVGESNVMLPDGYCVIQVYQMVSFSIRI